MPNLLAHSLVAKRIYLESDSKESRENPYSFLHGNYDYLVLGSIGPDPLFYMGLLPTTRLHLITAMKKIGNQIHKTDARRYFRFLVEQAYTIDNDKEKKRFQAFVFGQFSHYILDREAHPYVLYKSGFDTSGHITGKYHYEHAFFETNIDCSFAKNIGINRFISNPEETIPYHPSALSLIDQYYVPALKKTLELKKLPPKMYSNAVTNMRKFYKFMNHHGKFKSFLFGKRSALSAMYQIENPDFTVMNENNLLWKDPCTGEEHNESFLELHSRTYHICKQCMDDLLRFGFNYDVFKKYINGKNYYGEDLNAKRIYKEVK